MYALMQLSLQDNNDEYALIQFSVQGNTGVSIYTIMCERKH